MIRKPPIRIRWRILDTPPAPGAWNMAVDAALVESARAATPSPPPVLRFYRWSPPCLSLGRNQPARGEYDPGAIRARGIDVVRRPTGGRAVLHDRELTYSVIVADGVLGSPRAAYRAINRALVAGLRRLGVPAELQPRGDRQAPIPSLTPCFKEPVEGEVVAAGRKLVGSAQRREGGVILQHGSLLLDGDQSELRDLLRTPPPVAEQLSAALSGFLDPPPDWDTLTGALVEGCGEVLGGRFIPGDLSPAERVRASEIAEARFADPVWTLRR